MSAGIPQQDTVTFPYGGLDALSSLLERHEIACVILEAATQTEPPPGYLEGVRQKQTTREVMDALEKGGLPPSKYNTVYSILRRRENEVGDIINMKGDWALQEWYPNYRNKKSSATEDIGEEVQESSEAKEPKKAVTA